MGHCKDCKWWALHSSRKPRPYEPGDAFYCKHPLLNTDSVEIHDQEVSGACADEGGSILTGPEFGCVHWEQV